MIYYIIIIMIEFLLFGYQTEILNTQSQIPPIIWSIAQRKLHFHPRQRSDADIICNLRKIC